jgi:pimeloyl-ACP methyl ester carboxylesterase
MKLECDRGGEGSRLLMLLHGLGTTRHVWQRMLESARARWNGSWIAPDLRGHGTSPHAASYALGLHAADVAELVQSCGAWSEIVIVGHSMGGVIALALASQWFGIAPARVFGLGIKIAWTDNELAQLTKMAKAPVRWFATKEEATDRFLKVSGLAGLVDAGSSVAGSGLVQGEQGWRLAADPATTSIGAPPIAALISAACAPFHLARGETDAMASRAVLRACDATGVDISGAGHNAMVEKPDAVWDWIESRSAS